MNSSPSSSSFAWRQDLPLLFKARLNTFVLLTTAFGYAMGWQTQDATTPGGTSFEFLRFLHTLLGTAACAFGSAVFNQILEVEDDALMERTANRPLPARRMGTLSAFLWGFGLSAFGVIHLWVHAGQPPALLATLTLFLYILVYTPLKKVSSLNTLVGTLPGALPPMMGWSATGQPWDAPGSWFLFALLAFWQLPHFVAINWLCREEYEKAGYAMWSNGDLSGRKSASLLLFFTSLLTLVGFFFPPSLRPNFALLATALITLLCLRIFWIGRQFLQNPDRSLMRKLFLLTLLYLPVALALFALSWRWSRFAP